MATPYKIRITLSDSKETVLVEGSFTDEEWLQLTKFRQYVRELEESEYVSNGMPLDSKISWTVEEGFYSPTLPPASQIREFLHLLRPLILDDEATYFPRILNIIARHFQHPYFRDTIKTLRDGFLKGNTIRYFKVSIDELQINSEKALRLWLNAFEYHRDPEKEAKLRTLHQEVPFASSKSLLINQLRDKVDAMQWLAAFIDRIEKAPTNQH